METIIQNAKIFTGSKWYDSGCVWIGSDGNFKEVSSGLIYNENVNAIDLRGKIITAGYFDIHVHGGFGVRFGLREDDEEPLKHYSKNIASKGVTNFLTSIIGRDNKHLLKILEKYSKLNDTSNHGAIFSGIHLEGPYINPLNKGAFDPKTILPPSLEEGRIIISNSNNLIKQITIAPELPGAFELAKLFSESGITVAAGHTIASYEEALDAFNHHFSHLTHFYNAMTGLHHRKPGVVGAGLVSSNVTAELVSDLYHVEAAPIKILHKCKGAEKISIITDAMSSTGLPDGDYDDGGGMIRYVRNGKSTLADGTIAGSTATMDQCVKNLVFKVGLPIEDVFIMASKTPASIVGMDNEFGSIEVGKKANFLVLDNELNVNQTYVNGNCIFGGSNE